MIHQTIGVYPNGDYKMNGVPSEHLENHIEYNKLWRWGRALIVDGVVVYKGNVHEETLKMILDKIPTMYKPTKDTQPYH
jgi:hypothetical protein